MDFEEVRKRLLEAVSQGRSPSGFTHEDAAQEALTRAFGNDPSLKGEALYLTSLEQLAMMQREAFWEGKKGRFVGLAENSKASTQPEPATWRASKERKRRLPKGTARYSADGVEGLILRQSPGNILDEASSRAAACLAQEALLRVAAGEPCAPEAEALLLQLYEAFYGVSPGAHWVYLLLKEVEYAKSQATAAQQGAEAFRSPTGISLRRLKPDPGQEKNVVVRPEVVLTFTVNGRARLDFYAEIDGERTLLASAVGTFAESYKYSSDDALRNEEILQQVRLKLADLEISQELPPYADDQALVGWLFARFGFAGGGGQNAVSEASLRKLLQDPSRLADEIERHGRRAAERATDEVAEGLERDLLALARRIRTKSS